MFNASGRSTTPARSTERRRCSNGRGSRLALMSEPAGSREHSPFNWARFLQRAALGMALAGFIVLVPTSAAGDAEALQDRARAELREARMLKLVLRSQFVLTRISPARLPLATALAAESLRVGSSPEGIG